MMVKIRGIPLVRTEKVELVLREDGEAIDIVVGERFGISSIQEKEDKLLIFVGYPELTKMYTLEDGTLVIEIPIDETFEHVKKLSNETIFGGKNKLLGEEK